MITYINKSNPHCRIYSLDALRAFTLIGILFIHASQLFNYNNLHNDTSFMGIEHNTVYLFINKYLTERFRIIFSILFGISFYLLSNNSNYPKSKFIWRCIILTIIGIANKVFYTTDILFLYGICGIFMLPFLKLKMNNLLCFALFLWSIKFFFVYNNINIIESRDYTVRYLIQQDFMNVIQYPITYAMLDYIVIIFPFSICDTLAYFFFGYFIAYRRLIYRFDCFKICNIYGISLIAITIIIGVLLYSTHEYIIRKIFYLLTAISYSYIFICIYNYTKKYHTQITTLERMGKLGLTNYTFMNLSGVLFVSSFVFPYQLTYNHILIFALITSFFLLLFSNVWLKYYTNGPLESIWRKLTNACYYIYKQIL